MAPAGVVPAAREARDDGPFAIFLIGVPFSITLRVELVAMRLALNMIGIEIAGALRETS